MTELGSSDLESLHVRDVYRAIASDFARTRYKPWPSVIEFLGGLPPWSLLLDVGCGNGRCLAPLSLVPMACDNCPELLAMCARKGHECQTADARALPYRSNAFDAVICVAVLHHLATPASRLAALLEMKRVLRPSGLLLLTVWAAEHELNRGGLRDVLVPWHVASPPPDAVDRAPLPVGLPSPPLPILSLKRRRPPKDGDGSAPRVYHRYYHLFCVQELADLCAAADLITLNRRYEAHNWRVVLQRHRDG